MGICPPGSGTLDVRVGEEPWDMNNSKTKVLYIAGWGRSGSTILDNILGQIDAFFSVGELRYIWDRGLIENSLCGCDVPFMECEMWKQVLNEAFGGPDHIDAYEMLHLRDSFHTHHALLSLMPQGRQLLSVRLEKYSENLERLYQGIQTRTGCRVIVDSSKFPSYGYILGTLPSIDLYIVHLIRDSRAVAFSWLRKKLRDQSGGRARYMKQQSPLRSAWLWSTWNITVETLWKRSPERYLALRYEDFIQRPREAVEGILDLVQERTNSFPFVEEHKVELGINHTVSGNPSRFRGGTVELRLDEQWQEEMKQTDKTVVTMLTWPLLRHHGYLG
jgi:hypothetical protein